MSSVAKRLFFFLFHSEWHMQICLLRSLKDTILIVLKYPVKTTDIYRLFIFIAACSLCDKAVETFSTYWCYFLFNLCSVFDYIEKHNTDERYDCYHYYSLEATLYATTDPVFDLITSIHYKIPMMQFKPMGDVRVGSPDKAREVGRC